LHWTFELLSRTELTGGVRLGQKWRIARYSIRS